MNAEDKASPYSAKEAAQLLNKEINENFTSTTVSILAKGGKLQATPTDDGFQFSKRALVRYVVQWRMHRFDSKRLSEESRARLQKRKYLAWWEAICLFHGVEPLAHSSEVAGFQFPNVYPKLWQAINSQEIGCSAAKDSINTPTDTYKNWTQWFGKAGHVEQGWVDPIDDRTSFEQALETVTSHSAPSASSARKKAEYNMLARALYQAMAENPGEPAAKCAEFAAEALKTRNIHTKPGSITRRTGKIDQSLLESLQAKLRLEKGELS